jgi:hypothetical protein
MASNYKASRIRFRSPLLQAPVKVEKVGRAGRLAWRWPFLGLVLLLFLTVLFFLWAQPFGRTGPGQSLYWLHDIIYLPIKGYTFTLYHPDSWIWWGLIFTLLALWTASFALDRSLILRPHVALLKETVHRPFLGRRLLDCARYLAQYRVNPRLLISMVERERQLALHQLRGKAEARQCRQVAYLTRLLVDLYLLHKPDLLCHIKAAVRWHEAFRQLEVQAQKYGVGVAAAQDELINALPDIITPLTHLSDEELAARVAEPSGFDLYGLFIELVCLAGDGHGNLPAELPSYVMRPSPHAWLVEAVDRRRMALLEAQQQMRQPEVLRAPPAPLFSGDPNHASFVGQLAMSLAVHVALRANAPDVGLAYSEVVAATRLALSWIDGSEEALLRELAALSYDLPCTEHYQCLAWLSQEKQTRLQIESEVNNLLRGEKPLLRSGDLAIDVERSLRLHRAAGITASWLDNSPLLPDFDADQAPKAAFAFESLNLPLRRRIDGVLLTFGAVALSALLILWFFVVQTADSIHLLEAPVVSLLKDERILFNVRDNLPDSPFLDAVLHSDNRIYISQAGGLIHRYDPATGLWSYERPLPGDGLSNHNYVLLRSGCGDDPRSEAAKSCPEPNVLWAVTENGGLIKRSGRSWEVVVGDTAFRGANGRLMNSQDLTTAAVSGDGRWLVVGTDRDGFGVYNLQTRHWLTLPDELMERLPSLSITRMAWWRDSFWLAGPRGLITLSMRGGQPALADTPVVQGEIIDLDVGSDGGLWALANVACETDGNSCLWLGKLNHPEQPPQTILSQRNSYPALNLANLTFAQYRDDKLTVAGEAGIYLYDAVPHSWRRLFVPAVGATLPVADNDGFFFAYREGLGLVQDEAVVTWEMPDRDVVKLLYDGDDVLAFTQQGNLFALTGTPLTITEVFVGTQTSLEPEQFINAAGAGSQVLLVGPDGALLHNSSERRYEDLSARLVPDWLYNPTTRFLNAGTNIYALLPLADGRLNIRTLPATEFLTADFFTRGAIQDVSARATSAAVAQVWPWSQGIGVLQDNGIVDRLTPQNQTREIGPALAGFHNPTIVDVTSLNGNLVIASPAGLVTYDQANRSLAETGAYNNLRAIEAFGNNLLLVTAQGQLLRHDPRNPVSLIGAAEGFAISDAALSDGLLAQQNLYLAGSGRVEQYNADLRRMVERWDLPGQGAVRLAGIVDGKPVALTAGRAAWGDAELPGEGVVVALSLDDHYIWTVREGGDGRYLVGHPRQNPLSTSEARCFFRNPSAGAINRIQDARALPNGPIAVATDGGLRFYDPAARSCFLGPENVLPSGGRLYLLGDYLAAVSPIEDRLWLIRAGGVRVPGSCATGRVVLQDVTAVTVRAVTINEQTNRAAWITTEQAVVQWQNGQSSVTLPAVSEGPATSEIQRVYNRGNYWFFTTANALWRYDLSLRRWQPIALQFNTAAPVIAAINLESYSGEETVVVQGQDGSFYLGTFSGNSTTVSLSRIFTPPTETFNGTAASLLDVQQRGELLWTFVLDDQIRYYNPQQRQWGRSISLGTADSTLFFGAAFERGVLVGRNGQAWRVARSQETEPINFALFELQADETTYLDDTATIWRWQPDGSIWRCLLPAGTTYNCTQTHASFWLDSNQVHRAFAWRNLLLFETDNGFVALNTTSEEAAVLPNDLADWPPGSVVRQYGQQLWFYRQETLLILRQAANGQLAIERFTGLSQLIFDSSGRRWVRFGDQWRYWDDGRFITPPGVTNVFAWERTPTAALDGAGYPYWWDGDFVRDDFVLPLDIDLGRLNGLWRGGERKWWALAGTQLYHVTEGVCHPQTLAPFATQTPTPVPTVAPTGTPAAILPPTWTPAATPVITGTLTPSPTPTQTSTPTPTATPTPVPVPCFVVAGQINMAPHLGPAPVVLQAVAANNALTLTAEGNRSLQIQRQDGSYQVVLQQNVNWQLSALAQDRWPVVRGNMAALPNGREAYSPITSLTANQAGELIAVRPGKNLKLADQATNQFSQPPPLNVTWLRWNRGSRDFSVQTPTGLVNSPRQAVIVNGRLIFEEMLAVLAESPNSVYLANEHGLWLHRSDDLRLDDAGIVYQPIALGRSIEAAHGRFLVSVGDMFPGDTAVRPAQTSLTIQFGDITLTEYLRGRRVIAAGIAGLPIFTETGFIWDRNRRGLAFSDAGLRLQSDAGIHPVNALTNFDAGPNQLGRGTATLHYETGHGLFLRDNDAWYKHGSGGWSLQSANPTVSRVLLSNSNWEWRLANSTFQVNLAGAGHNFDYPRALNNFTFSSDRLRAAAAHQEALYLITEAFLEIAASPNQVGALSADRLAPLAADSLESFRFVDGSAALYRYAGEDVFRWSGMNRRFVAIAANEDPRQKRDLIRNDRLHFTYDRQQSPVVAKRLKVEHIQQGQHWIAFDFERGLFPFDIVTAVAVQQNRLYVGSHAGLQVYEGSSTGFNHMVHLYDMRPSPMSNALTAVENVGAPRDSPALLMARSTGNCIQTGGTTWTFCPNTSLLDWRLRVNTPLWQWLAGPDNRITGRYYDYQGALIPDPIVIANGRFPHDQVQNASVCRGHAFTLLQNGWLTVSTNDSLRLQAGQIYPTLGDQALRRFICLENELSLPQTTVAAGLYLEGGDEAVAIWEYDQRQWRPVESAVQQAALVERADFPPAWEQARLRLLFPQEENPFIFQQRDLGNTWHDLTWERGRLAIDRWHQLAIVDGALWAATPDGLVSFERNRAGRAILDPAALLILREPATPLCPITDMQEEQGEVWVRCRASSNQVYRGRLDGRSDRGLFTLAAMDPFVKQTLVDAEETAYWEFHLAGRALGSPGSLRAWLHGEETQLVGGQFAFDTLNSLAFLPGMPVNVATTESGWFHISLNNWHVRQWQRPSLFGLSPQQAAYVGVTRASAEAALCLRQADGGYVRLLPGEDPASTTSCPEYLADDDLWRYQQEESSLLITAVQSIGGVGLREMTGGRFSDDVIVGPPAAGGNGQEVFHLFPTQAGVIQRGQNTILYVLPFPGLRGSPTSVLLLERETPVYVGADALYNLDYTRETRLALALPADVRPMMADYTLDNLLRVRWRDHTQSGWTLVDPHSGQNLSANLMSVNVSQYDKYIANYERWGNPPPWLDVQVRADEIHFLSVAFPPYRAALGDPFTLVAPILHKDRLILIGRQELLSANLEYGLVQMTRP